MPRREEKKMSNKQLQKWVKEATDGLYKQSEDIREAFEEFKALAIGMSLLIAERNEIKMENYQLRKTIDKDLEFIESEGLKDKFDEWFKSELEKFNAEQEKKRKEAENKPVIATDTMGGTNE